MANIKSSKKRILTNQKAKDRNKNQRTAMRSSIRKIELAISEKNKELATSMLKEVNSKLDSAAGKGVVHKNYASRQKSRLNLQVNAI